MNHFVNTSAYKFVDLSAVNLPQLREQLREYALDCGLKGTILLGTEGINSFLSGTPENMVRYQNFLLTFSEFQGLVFRESWSTHQPFTRMLVRLKKEIISMGCDQIKPQEQTAPYLAPEVFREWYEAGKDMVVLDVRNDYEVALGHFYQAIDLGIETFRDFPNAVALLPKSLREKTIVTNCTGGIRCEKAGQFMLNHGFEEVYQLKGGILNYFEKCGGDYWEGECFVFDKRVAVNSALLETSTTQCYGCRGVLPLEAQGKPCPNCQAETPSREISERS